MNYLLLFAFNKHTMYEKHYFGKTKMQQNPKKLNFSMALYFSDLSQHEFRNTIILE